MRCNLRGALKDYGASENKRPEVIVVQTISSRVGQIHALLSWGFI